MRASGQPRPRTGNAGMWAGGCAGGRQRAECRLITVLLAYSSTLTSIAGSERHRYSQGFGREAKRFAILSVEAIVPLALLVATVVALAVRFAVPAVERTASSICWREISSVFLETLRTIGSTTQRSAIGTSRLRAIASSSI